jgi:probable rRNA maturation factor
MDISFQIDESFVGDIDPEPIHKAVRTTIQLFDSSVPTPGSTTTITITDNKTLQQLNYQYRGLNAPTDVLSFQNSSDPDFPNVDPALNYHLGDVIIAYPVAKAQAEAGGHSPLDEIILLAVHGTLHLLGFDHDTPKHKKIMWAAQHQIMLNLGLSHIQPTDE